MSTATIERLFDAMQASKGFPAMEGTVTRLIASLGDKAKCRQDLVDHIVGDFALTQKVLKLANSAMYAPFTEGAASISCALDVLGTDALLHIALSTLMVGDAEMQDDETLSQTLLSSELARNVCVDRSEDVSIAALMYNLGGLMTQRYLPTEAAAIDKKVASGQGKDAASSEILGLTLQQLGAQVASRWNLPLPIVSIIDGTGDPDLVAIARFSSAAAALVQSGSWDEVDHLVAALKVPGVDTSSVVGFARGKAALFQPRSDVVAPPLSSEAVLDELLASLADHNKKTVEELASAMFPTFANTLKTAHCLLFMRTKSGDFAIRYGHGKGIDELRSKLRISKEYRPTAFHAAIKNNVDVSIADTSRLKATALPDGYLALLSHVNKFVILPIANSAVSGFVYCDWDSDKVLSATELETVKKLRELFLPYFPA